MLSTTTIRQLRDELESLYAPPFRAPKTWYPLRQVFDELLALKIELVADLKPAAVAKLISSRPERAPITQKKLLNSMRTICNSAVQLGYLDKSPFSFRREWVRVPKNRAEKHHSAESISSVLLMLESERKLSWEHERLFALVSLFAYTGVRKLEGLRAKVEDFHLDEGFFDLVARDRLKTRESEALIPLPSRLVATLRDWLPQTGSEWAFPHKLKTGPWTEGRMGHKPLDQIKIAGERAGVKGFTILSLRHSWATHAESLWDLGEGVTKRVLRHTTTRTQLHYRHADLPNLRRRVEGLSFDGGGVDFGQKALRA